ncbi:hypothetical protein AMAG_01303 [Allomyces macrogynus ATCC 38327]|uniref:Uncharacterized protein n=1 Tax=Allomyces macrogynus (strain ATCC 38327) TaxID=578462 RepID=A0A0L0RYE0_ALLM3|nr:hypothetical protein AMAG_01303 [Allomyces macrogynus ATCC 38327]|eukprot:KNE55407.1 hypothetical protein AMAG_01303 [Allomyces macrogynus ATCC 38327]
MPCHCAHQRTSFRDRVSGAARADEPDFDHDLVGFAEPDARTHYAPNMVLEPVHIDVHTDFDFEHATAKFAVTHTVRCNRDVPAAPAATPAIAKAASQLKLHAVSFDDVEVEGELLAGFEYDGKELHVQWAAPFAKDEERHVTIRYSVTKPVSGLFFAHPSYDRESYGEYVVTDHETERARYWLPTVDEPTVRTKLSFALTAPAHMHAYANGALVGEEESEDGSKKTTKYHLDFPCPSYLICMAVGDFTVVDDRDAHGIPIKYFGPKAHQAEHILKAFDSTPAMVEWLSTRVGVPFPWPKYFQFTAPFIGGAMENISLVSWGDFVTMDDTHARDWKFLIDTVNIHEMAHTYFGDMTGMSCSLFSTANTARVIRYFEHAWLKESWATYIEGVWVEENHGATPEERHDNARLYRFNDQERYISETQRYLRPVVCRKYDHSWNMFDMTTYPGGGARIHMLRSLLGDAVFWPAVAAYLQRYAGKTVETEDFKRVMEEFSGLNLTQFFDQWFHSKGYPIFKASFQYDADRKVAAVMIEQTQADLKKRVPLFAMDVAVEFATADGTVYRAVAQFTGDNARAQAAIAVPTKPARVEIDPDGHQLFGFAEDFKPAQEILLGTAKTGRDVVNRIRAYRTLIKDADFGTLRKIHAAAIAEPVPGVRKEVVFALAPFRHAAAVAVLVDVVRHETADSVKAEMYNVLRFKHAQIRPVVLELLQQDDLTYMQRGALLRALAVQRNPEDWATIAPYYEDTSLPDLMDTVRAAALLALSEYRTPEAARYLLAQAALLVNVDVHDQLRGAVYTALAKLAPWVDTPLRSAIVETIAQGLTDRSATVRYYRALGALKNLGKEALPYTAAIEASLPLYAEQDKGDVRKAINRIRKAGAPHGSKAAALTTRIEELEKLVRKLEAKNLTFEDEQAQAKETAAQESEAKADE